MKNFKIAFTLAEVLITIAIVGVVAAITIPSLLNKYYEKQTLNRLKHFQSEFAQAMRMAEEESGDMEGWFTDFNNEIKDAQEVATYLKPFFKLALDCGQTDTRNDCVPNLYYKEKNGNGRENYVIKNYYKVKLLNGSSVWWAYNHGEKLLHVYIDTNGTKSPNTWGKDFFMFEYANKTLKPMGAPNSIYPYTTQCLPKSSTGIGCAYYVLNKGNMNYLH
jgi:prepilin-type N-terminal cleavage/methylation domain-containing protein